MILAVKQVVDVQFGAGWEAPVMGWVCVPHKHRPWGRSHGFMGHAGFLTEWRFEVMAGAAPVAHVVRPEAHGKRDLPI